MHNDLKQGLKLLHEVDKQVLSGFEFFTTHYLPYLSALVDKQFQAHGRCFLIGSGSSGRIAVDIAAKCANDKVIGIIAGGDSAFIRAKEGFEDSEEDGRNLITAHEISAHDLLILVSASGSASFNVGAAIAAKEKGATVCYFYNSKEVPQKTERLFTDYGVIPILVDIGPQAITGSTRLQAASLAELCLACLLTQENPDFLLQALIAANRLIEEQFPAIASIIQLEQEVFSHPQANFRKLHDETSQGYVTFLAHKNALREVVMDTVEIPPTFSTNPPRGRNDWGKKRAEFQAFLTSDGNNFSWTCPWTTLLGRAVHPDDQQEVAQFNISEAGLETDIPFRPVGEGNLVIGVTKNSLRTILCPISHYKGGGAKTALIAFTDHQNSFKMDPWCDAILIVDGLQKDKSGIVETIVLKQLLNMISNGSMIMMNKVFGNQMVDVKPSNKKLIDRSTRLVQDVFTSYQISFPLSSEELYSKIISISKKKNEYDLQNTYTPSVVKIAVTMIYKNLNFEDAIEFLNTNQEQLEKVFTL